MNLKRLVRTTLAVAVTAVVLPVSAQAEAPAITGGPGALTNSSTLSFSFNLAGAMGYNCAFDGGDFGTCASPLVMATLGDGSHTLSVKATVMTTVEQCIDFGPPIGVSCIPMPSVGDSEVATYVFVVDRTLPSVTVTSGPKDRSSSKSTTASFAFGAEAGSTYACALDAKPAVPCVSPFKVKKLKAGVHKLVVTPTDAAGNVGKPFARIFAVNSKTKAFKFVSATKVKQCAVKKKRLVKCKTRKV